MKRTILVGTIKPKITTNLHRKLTRTRHNMQHPKQILENITRKTPKLTLKRTKIRKKVKKLPNKILKFLNQRTITTLVLLKQIRQIFKTRFTRELKKVLLQEPTKTLKRQTQIRKIIQPTRFQSTVLLLTQKLQLPRRNQQPISRQQILNIVI